MREGWGGEKRRPRNVRRDGGGGEGESYVEREKRDIMGREVTCAGGRGMRVET